MENNIGDDFLCKGQTYILKNQKTVTAININKAKIQIGEKNNRLTICDRAPNTKSKKVRVICRCDCGKYTIINYQDFKTGKVKSCGCLSTEQKRERCKKTAIDFSSPERNINPFYEYVSPTEMRKGTNNQIVWKIRCRQCGEQFFDAPNELISEKRTHGNNPCQCWRKYSIGIQKILNILEQNNIQYELEKTFETCKSPKGNLLRFDIYLPQFNILIEYDGEQHFKITFNQDEQKLILQQEYDKIKNEWCINNNIKLIRIPYYKKNISLNDILKEKVNE